MKKEKPSQGGEAGFSKPDGLFKVLYPYKLPVISICNLFKRDFDFLYNPFKGIHCTSTGYGKSKSIIRLPGQYLPFTHGRSHL
jgi:hypothetical protein